MLLGCNYSKELIDLIRENKVDVDYIKLGLFDMYADVVEEASSMRPILIHGFGYDEYIGMKNMKDIDWKRVNEYIVKFKTPHIGTHMLCKKHDWDNEASDEEILNFMMRNIELWKRNINIPFLIENMPYSDYYSKKGIRKCYVDTEVINKICEEKNVDVLLDVAHAKIAAYGNGESIYDYLGRFPLNRIREIHLAGTFTDKETGLRDKHLEMEEEDYKILEWLLDRTNPEVITLEYGGPGEHFANRSDKDAIERQLKRLMRICNK
jgi:uncharacterized protein (UPF0276 family)